MFEWEALGLELGLLPGGWFVRQVPERELHTRGVAESDEFE